jgi:hypothetical protein
MKKKIDVIYFSKIKGDPDTDGLSWHTKRTIAIDNRVKGVDELDTIIHEVFHIQNPNWDEKMVKNKATELAKILWDLGYRKVEV